MEVCGTHTLAICKYGIRNLLPGNIRLISGPGCPVCVTPNQYLDKAIAYSKQPDIIITTFGDIVRVPGSSSSLEKERARGSIIKVVYSTMDAIKIAQENHSKKVLFLGIGFETTAPTIAASIIEARRRKINNYFILCGNKLIPPVMEALLSEGEIKIDGFICPGHVSTIIGSKPYSFIPERYGLPCVIAGFEPIDILYSIYLLVRYIQTGTATVEVQYKRSVREEGNIKAQKLIQEVLEVTDTEWRGLGLIKNSGLKICRQYKEYDIEEIYPVEIEQARETSPCLCGEILKGLKLPFECLLFGTSCTPWDPKGPCMVSSEGTCAAYYRNKSWPLGQRQYNF
jgi:hydrogenase expression/formation protein HypD